MEVRMKTRWFIAPVLLLVLTLIVVPFTGCACLQEKTVSLVNILGCPHK